MHSVMFLFSDSFLLVVPTFSAFFFFVCYSNVSEKEGKNDPLFKYVKDTVFFFFLLLFTSSC